MSELDASLACFDKSLKLDPTELVLVRIFAQYSIFCNHLNMPVVDQEPCSIGV